MVVTWEDFRSGASYYIYAQRLNSAGVRQWIGLDGLLSGRLICNATGNQRTPKICTDGSAIPGGCFIPWGDQRAGANKDDVYAQYVTTGAVVQWAANGVALGNIVNTNEQHLEDMAY